MVSKGFLALHQIPKRHGLLCYAWQFCPKQSCVHSPGTSSLLIPASLACANAWIAQLMSCAFAQCWCSYLPQDPQYPVFDLMCVPSVMQRKCKASKMAGAGLLQSPLPVVEDGSMGLRLCNSESPFSIPGSECPLRATRHHINKWPKCNCAAAKLSLTSYS